MYYSFYSSSSGNVKRCPGDKIAYETYYLSKTYFENDKTS